MSWDSALDALDAAVYGTFSRPGTYAPVSGEPPFPIAVILDHNVELIGEYGQVSEPVTTMTVSKSELQAIKRDDEVTVDGVAHVVVRLLSDDGRDLRFVVTP